ncbi:endonuclease/exonuclease/phosphatase (EEP) superfamily protein YafD [Povalibacter uvarum]|uniref:Endonuclease/exonuclease/phosphatase (EEP) superfamily protein YafD n=1 Tax=Povalibacter uvarum TaxID=732238 RepID=A0A841HK09_9GAMM|nr:endonuclease/exonuclease/phosphatase family protein [Povalibacter uvarum]MBB6092719.1 endonuclease/exonuclease/phosphatase (EEP) superfamily protein YafD [Povalibacter uvarum]
MTTPSPRASAALRITARLALLTALSASFGFLIGFAGHWWWVLDLFSHFRLQYAIALLVSAGVLFSVRRPRSGALVLATALLVGASVVSYTGWPPLQSARATSGEFRFVTFNQYYTNQDAAGIGRYLESLRADVIAVQELPTLAAAEQLAAQLPSYPHMHAKSWYPYGAVIFSRWPIQRVETIELAPYGALAAKAVIDWEGKPVAVVGVHLHWPIGPNNVRLRNAEMKQLVKVAEQTPEPLLIGGDFNVSSWSQNFRRTFDESPLHDCARGLGLVNTWPSHFAPLAIRIDQCLASDHWEVLHVSRGPALGSDHFPTVTDLQLRRKTE